MSLFIQLLQAPYIEKEKELREEKWKNYMEGPLSISNKPKKFNTVIYYLTVQNFIRIFKNHYLHLSYCELVPRSYTSQLSASEP